MFRGTLVIVPFGRSEIIKKKEKRKTDRTDIARPNTISCRLRKLSFRLENSNENFISFCSINFLFLLLVLPIRCTVSFPGNEWTRRSRHVLPFIEHVFPYFFPTCISFFFFFFFFFPFFLPFQKEKLFTTGISLYFFLFFSFFSFLKYA